MGRTKISNDPLFPKKERSGAEPKANTKGVALAGTPCSPAGTSATLHGES